MKNVVALGVASLGLAAGVAVAPTATAHDQIVSTNPVAGAHLSQPPRDIALTFNEKPLDVGSEAVVKNPDGSRQTLTPKPSGNGVSFPFSAKGNGEYAVTWRVVSSDGHPISGSFGFSVKGAASSSASAPTSAAASASSSSPAASSTTSHETDQKSDEKSLSKPLWLALGLGAVGVLLGIGVLIRRRSARSGPGRDE